MTISRSKRRRNLLGRLGRVAEVGEEAVPRRVAAPSAVDQRQAVAAGEAGQVAHVHRRADEQRVDLALAQLAGQALDALRSWRRARGALTSRRRSSSLAQQLRARRRSRPGRARRSSRSTGRRSPTIRRHGSRVLTSERWISSAGSAGDLERVADRPRVVRPRARVQQDRVGLPAQLVQALDERALVVGLKEARPQAQLDAPARRSAARARRASASRRAADRAGRAGRG